MFDILSENDKAHKKSIYRVRNAWKYTGDPKVPVWQMVSLYSTLTLNWSSFEGHIIVFSNATRIWYSPIQNLICSGHFKVRLEEGTIKRYIETRKSSSGGSKARFTETRFRSDVQLFWWSSFLYPWPCLEHSECFHCCRCLPVTGRDNSTAIMLREFEFNIFYT